MAEITKDILQARAQLVRVYEANCGIEHPTDDDLKFRRSVSIALGCEYGLAQFKNLPMPGPSPTKQASRPSR